VKFVFIGLEFGSGTHKLSIKSKQRTKYSNPPSEVPLLFANRILGVAGTGQSASSNKKLYVAVILSVTILQY
jgi:hypothetical protein